MTNAFLEAENITKTYQVKMGTFKGHRPLHAVNGVDISIEKGEVLGIVGESGCGKSTLAKIILGLEKPTTGHIKMKGINTVKLGRLELTRKLQPVFQDPYSSLNARKTVGSSISLPLRVHKVGNKASQDRKIDEIMEIVGLPPRLKHSYPNQLSGGQRQRVAIARALIMRPDIVICDEPTSALDVSIQSQILNLLLKLRKELDLTYFIISHDLAVVEHIATRVAVMYLGKVVEEAKTEDLFKKPKHPYTQALLESVLTPDPSLGLPDTHLGIAYPNPIDIPSGCSFHPRCPVKTELCVETYPRLETLNGNLVACHHAR